MNVLDYVNSREYKQVCLLSMMRRIISNGRKGSIASLDSIAKSLNISSSHLSMIESGTRQASPDLIKRYCDILQGYVKIDDLHDIIHADSIDTIDIKQLSINPLRFVFEYLQIIYGAEENNKMKESADSFE